MEWSVDLVDHWGKDTVPHSQVVGSVHLKDLASTEDHHFVTCQDAGHSMLETHEHGRLSSSPLPEVTYMDYCLNMFYGKNIR